MLKRFEGDVQLIYYHYTLNPTSQVAAQAALCAGEQGHFWEFQHMLYARQEQWSRLPNPLDTLIDFAPAVALDATALRRCVKSGRMRQLIDADKDYGNTLQVRSTPTLFINNQRIVGAQPEAELVRVLRQELGRVKRNAS